MKEFSDSLPASDLEHFRLNMFNYFRKYICVHASSIHLMTKTEEENETATISNFLHLCTFHQCNKEVFIQRTKNNKFKNRKENYYWSAKRSSCTCRQYKWKPLGRLMKRKRIQRRCSIRSKRFRATPIQLYLKEVYGECYPPNLAPNPEMKAVSYASETFGRCSIIFFSKSW